MGEEGQAGGQLARTTEVHLETEGAKNRPRKSRGYRDINTTIDVSRQQQLGECFLKRMWNCNLVENARVGRQEGIHTQSLSFPFSGSAAIKGQKKQPGLSAVHTPRPGRNAGGHGKGATLRSPLRIRGELAGAGGPSSGRVGNRPGVLHPRRGACPRRTRTPRDSGVGLLGARPEKGASRAPGNEAAREGAWRGGRRPGPEVYLHPRPRRRGRASRPLQARTRPGEQEGLRAVAPAPSQAPWPDGGRAEAAGRDGPGRGARPEGTQWGAAAGPAGPLSGSTRSPALRGAHPSGLGPLGLPPPVPRPPAGPRRHLPYLRSPGPPFYFLKPSHKAPRRPGLACFLPETPARAHFAS